MANENTETKVSWLTRIVQLNPVLIRGVLVSVAALLAAILGRTVIDNDLIDAIIDGFVAITGLVAALWARGKVIAENKVIAWNPNPLETDDIKPGLAVVTDIESRIDDLGEAASHSVGQGDVRAAA